MKIKQFFLLIMIMSTFSSIVKASDEVTPPISAFAKHAKFYNVKLSPDGKYLAATMSNDEGKRIVGILDKETFKVTGYLNFTGKEFPSSFFWLNNERLGITIAMKSGALAAPFGTGEIFAMNVDASQKKVIAGSRSQKKRRRPTHTQILDLMLDDPEHILVQESMMSRKKPKFSTVYRLNVYTGKKKKIGSSPGRGGRLLADQNGQIRFATGMKSDDGINTRQLYYREKNGDDWQEIESVSTGDTFKRPIAFTKDNENVYMYSNVGTGTTGIFLYNIESGQSEKIFQHDFVDIGYSDIDHLNRLFAVHHEADYSHVEVIDPNHPIGRWYPAFKNTFKGAKFIINSYTLDMKEMTIHVQTEKNPGTFYLFNSETKVLKELVKAKPWLSEENLGTTEAFKFVARDGQDIYGYLTLPKNKESNLPLIVIPHGGPHGPRDYWTYDDDVQILASRGYAVLKVNFRGSGGYGNAFEQKGYRQWGGTIMDDITDATNWAIKQKVADPKRVCIYGASFGGYASLMSVIKEPELYQCALGYVGVYDLDLMYRVGDVKGRESGINYLEEVLGKNETELASFSPTEHVDKIKADLFIVHGEKDERAHYDHALLLRKKLDEAKIPYQWMTKPKEAHGFYSEDNRAELYEKMLAFFDKNIGH